MLETLSETRVIDVRSIPKPKRHPLIFDAMEKLAVGESLVVQNDHNPIALRGQVETIYSGQFEWRYFEEGPEVFRLQFTRRASAPAGWKRPESKKSLPTVQETSAPSPDDASVSTAARNTASASTQAAPAPTHVDLLERCGVASRSGPQWGHECEDLDLTLLSWEEGKRIEPHVNNEVDVVWIGVEGAGIVTVNGEKHELRPAVALLIPKGCERAVESTSGRFSYLSVHRRRRGLMPTIGGKPLA